MISFALNVLFGIKRKLEHKQYTHVMLSSHRIETKVTLGNYIRGYFNSLISIAMTEFVGSLDGRPTDIFSTVPFFATGTAVSICPYERPAPALPHEHGGRAISITTVYSFGLDDSYMLTYSSRSSAQHIYIHNCKVV